MRETPSEILQNWVLGQAGPEAGQWFAAQLDALAAAPDKKRFEITFGMIPRRLGRRDLELSEADLRAAVAARQGWNPSRWSIDTAARILLLVRYGARTDMSFAELFKDLHRTADLAEVLALYNGLPLFPEPETLVEMAVLGLRTNIRAEFQAIAHNNPYPAEQFDQNPWNNMVLKALFIGVMLEPIQGLDQRANPELARILHDYAHERWAADRAVSPELWRCIGPFATGALLQDFQKVADQGNETEKKAVALALRTTPALPENAGLRAQLSMFDGVIASGALTWTAIAEEMLDKSLAITRKLNTEVELTR